MYRHALLNLLYTYSPFNEQEAAMHQETIDFVTRHSDCFERTLQLGHVTGSALIVSPDRQQVVLIHHRKLDRWFQPGGHCDGDPDVLNVARREAEEETGLTRLNVVNPTIFDIDVHGIPARGNEPSHLHYDIRFLFEADPSEPFQETAETKEIRWVSLSEVPTFSESDSVLRMISKIIK